MFNCTVYVARASRNSYLSIQVKRGVLRLLHFQERFGDNWEMLYEAFHSCMSLYKPRSRILQGVGWEARLSLLEGIGPLGTMHQ